MDTENALQENNRLSLKVWGKVAPYFLSYKKIFGIITCLHIFMAAYDVALPLFLRYAVDNFIEKKSADGLWAYAAIYLALVIIQVALTALNSMSAIRIEMYVGRDLKRDCFLKLQSLGLGFYSQNSVGSLISRLFSDTNRIVGVVAWTAVDLIWDSFYIIGALWSMSFLNFQLTLVTLPIFPIAFAVVTIFRSKILKANRIERQANAAIIGAFNEGITGAKTTKTLSIEQANAKRFGGYTSEMYKAVFKSQILNAVFTPLIAFVSTCAAAAVMVRGGSLAISGLIELGTLSAFLSYCLGILEPISSMSRIISELISTQPSIERVAELLEQSPGVSDTKESIETYGDSYNPKKSAWEEIIGEIEFQNVSFRYPSGERDILSNFSLKIPPGSTIAIVGETGAGKSTIVNLACRFYEPTEGRILIDGKDIKERSQMWLHSQLGYVLQDPHLFSGTIEYNVRYGKLTATEEEVRRAAEIVGLDKVVEKLDGGYQTEVGESGGLLSTGEKQLVSFARAIVGDPPILVLDEATSSVDTEIEAALQEAIHSMTRLRTSIIIAHRLSTIRSADLILLISDGKIIESGKHAALLAQNGAYAKLYMSMYAEEKGKTA